MGYKLIFPQMFDVRPRLGGGDLDLEKIERIKAILNLRFSSEKEFSERTINLKKGFKELNNKQVKINIFSPVEPESLSRELYEENPVLDKNGLDFWPELSPVESQSSSTGLSSALPKTIVEIQPSQAEILSVFEAVEAMEQALKLSNGSKVVELKKDQPVVFDIEPEITIVKKPEKAQRIFIEDQESIKDSAQTVPILIQKELVSELGYEPDVRVDSLINDNSSRDLSSNLWLQKAEIQSIPDYVLDEDAIWKTKNYDQSQDMPGGQYLTPEFLLGKKASGESRWRINKRPLVLFLTAAFLISLVVPLAGWINRASDAKNRALVHSFSAYQSLIQAKESLGQFNFIQAQENFAEAKEYFVAADLEISKAGGWLIWLLKKIPGLSYFSSRIRLVRVGSQMSQAGEDLSATAGLIGKGSVDFMGAGNGKNYFSETIAQAKKYLSNGFSALITAKQDLSKIDISSLPQEIQPQMASFQEKMPQILGTAASALDWTDNFLKILGHEKAKKYLLIFQNNSEARATGGFIGTYGILDLDRGNIEKLFIDGIYNPDGQLLEKIAPPKPLQGISKMWRTHDANWFADWPLSAQKIMWFYEKTGGATTDGVISLTPTVIERLLELTGPIQMPEYGLTLDAKNFMDLAQNEVEVEYDKALNQPKKILADFTPKFIDKLSEKIKENNIEILKAIIQAFKEKHILVYFSDSDLEQFAKDQGWAGEILSSPGDYLSVVNTNILGFKTDRVVKEEIKYLSEINQEGSIINTISVTRRHEGGSLAYDWYNKINTDYLRVYVPKGSEFISVSGQIAKKEIFSIDYKANNYKTDSDLAALEQSIKIDEASGTQIFEESGKTVFGNWVEVSPGQSATITYKYKLPFKIDISKSANFSLTAQKQSGSVGSNFIGEIKMPKNWQIAKFSPDFLKIDGNLLKWETGLSIDRILEINFTPSE